MCRIKNMKPCNFVKKEINNLMVSEDTDGGSECVPPSRRSFNPLSTNQINQSIAENNILQNRYRFQGVSSF
jgi:hypothetical protein